MDILLEGPVSKSGYSYRNGLNSAEDDSRSIDCAIIPAWLQYFTGHFPAERNDVLNNVAITNGGIELITAYSQL